MCVIARTVSKVATTKITVLPSIKDGAPYQTVMYSCRIVSLQDNAMILPAWNPGNNPDKIQLHSLEKCPYILDNLSNMFKPITGNNLKGVAKREYLPTYRVGNYIVSIAPKLSDVADVTPELSIPSDLLAFLATSYSDDFSYIVAKFIGGDHKFHPLAYSHPRMENIFIPTLHWHKHFFQLWQNTSVGDFDHEIFMINGGLDIGDDRWRSFINIACDKAEPKITPDGLRAMCRIVLEGKYKNCDVILPWSLETDKNLTPLIDEIFS